MYYGRCATKNKLLNNSLCRIVTFWDLSAESIDRPSFIYNKCSPWQRYTIKETIHVEIINLWYYIHNAALRPPFRFESEFGSEDFVGRGWKIKVPEEKSLGAMAKVSLSFLPFDLW